MVMAWSPLLLVFFFVEDCFWLLEKQAVCLHCSGPRLRWMRSASQHGAVPALPAGRGSPVHAAGSSESCHNSRAWARGSSVAGQRLQHAAQAVQQFPSPSLQNPRHSTKLLGRGCP